MQATAGPAGAPVVAENAGKIAAVRDAVLRAGMQLSALDDVNGDIRILRFLQGNNGDVDAAIEQYVAHLRWREENNIDDVNASIKSKPMAWESFPNGQEICQHFNLIPFLGYTYQGHMINYTSFGPGFDVSGLASKEGGEDRFFEGWRAYLERRNEILHVRSKQQNKLLMCTELKSFKGLKLRAPSISGDDKAGASPKKIMKRVMKEGTTNYPESCDKVVFLHVPSFFSLIMSIFSGLLNENIRNKFVLVYNKGGDSSGSSSGSNSGDESGPDLETLCGGDHLLCTDSGSSRMVAEQLLSPLSGSGRSKTPDWLPMAAVKAVLDEERKASGGGNSASAGAGAGTSSASYQFLVQVRARSRREICVNVPAGASVRWEWELQAADKDASSVDVQFEVVAADRAAEGGDDDDDDRGGDSHESGPSRYFTILEGYSSQKHKADGGPVVGEFTAAAAAPAPHNDNDKTIFDAETETPVDPGFSSGGALLWLIWENTYSWFTSKSIQCRLEVTLPS